MDVPSTAQTDGKIRLRRDVYDALVAERGATAVADQMRLTGLQRKTLYRIRRGDNPSLASAMKMAESLGVPVPALFERVRGAA